MPRLSAMPENWNNAVCVVPHPDDMEYGPASAVAKWTAEGKRVSYVVISSGEAGIEGTPPHEAGPLREAEERAAAARVGVHEVRFLGFPDSGLRDTAELRAAVGEAIAAHAPELVVTLNHRAKWAYGGGNTADHQQAGTAVVEAARREPSVRWIAVADSPRISHAVDVTETIDAGLGALREHRAYLEALGGEDWSVNHVLGNARQAGRMFGTELACAFELIER